MDKLFFNSVVHKGAQPKRLSDFRLGDSLPAKKPAKKTPVEQLESHRIDNYQHAQPKKLSDFVQPRKQEQKALVAQATPRSIDSYKKAGETFSEKIRKKYTVASANKALQFRSVLVRKMADESVA